MRLRPRNTTDFATRDRVATVFMFVVVNGTWVLIAYLLHTTGVRPRPIAIVVTVGVLMGNLATYAGVNLARKILRKTTPGNSNLPTA